MTGAWLVQWRTHNAGWVDVVWSFAVGAAGVAYALYPLQGAMPTPRQWLVAMLAAAWSLRLGLHIAGRTGHGTEDARYAQFRRDWGAAFQSRMFWFLQIQAAAAALLAVSMLLAARNPRPLSWVDGVALLVLLVAIAGEAMADWQLRRFRADPGNRGRVLRYRAVGLVAASELLLRMARLGGLSTARDRPARQLSLGLAGTFCSGLHVLAAGLRLGRAATGAADAAVAGRGVSGIPGARECVFSASSSEVIMNLVAAATRAVERVALPDSVTRAGIALLVERTSRRLQHVDQEAERVFASEMARYPIALKPDDANAQHYELPPAFFAHILGPRRKYSCCLYDGATTTLAEAEERALAETAAHAGLEDGQRVLELGCGWGSLTLWMAERFPRSHDRRGVQLAAAAGAYRGGGGAARAGQRDAC